jgi:hypothetical protein
VALETDVNIFKVVLSSFAPAKTMDASPKKKKRQHALRTHWRCKLRRRCSKNIVVSKFNQS